MSPGAVVEQRDAITELVQQHVGTHTGSDKVSVAAFCRVAIDPDSGYQPSNGLIGKIVRGETYKVTPQLVGAIAAGLRISRAVAAAAAHLQLIGYEEKELTDQSVVTLLRLLPSQDAAS